MKKLTLAERLQKQIMPADAYRRLGVQDTFTKRVILLHGIIQNYVIIKILQVYRVLLINKYHIMVFEKYCYKLFTKKSLK